MELKLNEGKFFLVDSDIRFTFFSNKPGLEVFVRLGLLLLVVFNLSLGM